jgi:hypothetical protein
MNGAGRDTCAANIAAAAIPEKKERAAKRRALN